MCCLCVTLVVSIRCQRETFMCARGDAECLYAPLSYSVNFITLPLAALRVPTDLFTMRVSVSAHSRLQFELKLIRADDPTTGDEITQINDAFFRVDQVDYTAFTAPQSQYTPPSPTRLNCRVESRRRCVFGFTHYTWTKVDILVSSDLWPLTHDPTWLKRWPGDPVMHFNFCYLYLEVLWLGVFVCSFVCSFVCCSLVSNARCMISWKVQGWFSWNSAQMLTCWTSVLHVTVNFWEVKVRVQGQTARRRTENLQCLSAMVDGSPTDTGLLEILSAWIMIFNETQDDGLA